jgi:ABC-type cobalamin/Fe3+-siderophores transport system ATPase subunit
MKFRKIIFEEHPIMGNISFDFTDKDGQTVDTVILAGENGCGKTVLLEELYNYNPSILYDRKYGKITAEIELSSSEIELLKKNPVLKSFGVNDIYSSIIVVKQDFSIKGNWEQSVVSFFSAVDKKERISGYVLSQNNNNLFKPVFSDVGINFTPETIRSVASSNIDEEIQGANRSSKNVATEITQLLIDIDNLDNGDLARWVKKHPGLAPSEDVQSIRMKRFTHAFYSIIPNKRFDGIDNENGHKVVYFEEYGKRMPIEKLSSGEKQIVFRGGFLLKNQKTTEGSVVLVDEPEISLHPKWQLQIMSFLKNLFMRNGQQTSQIIVATHSPFIIHNRTRNNDKVIVIKKNNDGVITVCENPEYYSWSEERLVQEAFNVKPLLEENKINVFLEGETDEKYYNKAMDVFGIDRDKISFKWIGRNIDKGKSENTGDKALNHAVSFFKANPEMTSSPIVMLYDCDTNKPSEDEGIVHVRMMTPNLENITYKKGVENLLNLPDDFDKDKFYKNTEKTDEYGAVTISQSLDKMMLCEYICSLDNTNLSTILKNISDEIQKLLLI